MPSGSIPDDRDLVEGLTGPSYSFPGVKGQLMVEKKSDMKKRGLGSPDEGDCLAMSFAVNLRAPEPIAEEELYSASNQKMNWMR